MADFETSASVTVSLDESSLGDARTTIEEELSADPITVSADTGSLAMSDGGSRGMGRTLSRVQDSAESIVRMADERNTILSEMLDTLETQVLETAQQGGGAGGGGGLLSGMAVPTSAVTGGGGILGGVGLGSLFGGGGGGGVLSGLPTLGGGGALGPIGLPSKILATLEKAGTTDLISTDSSGGSRTSSATPLMTTGPASVGIDAAEWLQNLDVNAPTWLKELDVSAPDWLQGIDLDVPRWLQNVDLSVPTWLDDVDLQPPPWLQEVDIGVPGWLKETDLGIPSWLQGIDLGVPSWLQGINLGVPSWLQGINLGVPDWLSNGIDINAPSWLQNVAKWIGKQTTGGGPGTGPGTGNAMRAQAGVPRQPATTGDNIIDTTIEVATETGDDVEQVVERAIDDFERRLRRELEGA